MEDGEIIVIDKVEDDSYDGKEFKKVTDKAGNKFNVKSGRGGALKDKWPLLQEGVAIKLQVGEFNKKPFVQDFTVVKDVFVAQATEKVQTQVRVEKNDSIEAQVAFKGMVELISTGMVKSSSGEYKATIEWAMSRLHSVSQIMATIEEAKDDVEIVKDSPKAQVEPPTGQDSGEATDGEPKSTGQLLNWIMSKDSSIKNPRVWIQTGYNVTEKEVLTIEKCKELYNQIKADKGW